MAGGHAIRLSDRGIEFGQGSRISDLTLDGLAAKLNTIDGTLTLEAPRREPRRTREDRVGRNDPCWCGSGKKFKRCHGA
jgi:hypothetical protein